MSTCRLTSYAVVLTLLLSLAGCGNQTIEKFTGTWEGEIQVQDYRIEDIGTDAEFETKAMTLRLEFLDQNKLRLTAIQGDQTHPIETEYHVIGSFLDEFTLKLGKPDQADAHSVIIRFEGEDRLIFKQVNGDSRVIPIEMKKVEE